MTYRVVGTSSTSTLYVFAISRVGGERPSHTVSKSYADFVELNDALRAELNAAASANSFLIGAAELAGALPPLPPKSTIGRRKAAVIAERQEALTQYLLRTTHTRTHTPTCVLLSVAPYGWMDYTHRQEHVVRCTIWVNGLHTQTGA